MFDLSRVEYAVLETDGRLNVIPFPAALPPTAEQMGVNTPDGGCPLIVISEGRVIEKNLKALGHDVRWLQEELRRQHKRETKEIYLMTVNHAGQSYIAEKEAGA